MDNAMHEPLGVIDNNKGKPLGVIDNAKSKVRRAFDVWANDLRDVQAVRMRQQGRGGRGGGLTWWRTLDDRHRAFILSTVCPDDWEKWIYADWAALPDGLRTAISIETKAVMRALEGCPWR